MLFRKKVLLCILFHRFMKKSLLILLVSFILIPLSGQIPDQYYSSAANKKGYALRVALHHIIKDHEALTYSELWNAFPSTDRKPNGKVWDPYSDNPGGEPAYEYTFITDQCGNYSTEGDCYNREHSVPASWFNDATPLYTDLFHLYPTDGYVNNRRSNYPYGKVGSATWTSLNGSKVGSCTTPGYTGTVFEPIDEYKGDFARSYFYMTVRYMDKNMGVTANSMFTNGSLKPWALQLLIQWHNQDPVSQKELNRNEAIFALQENRNPFIDFPELVGKIYGNDSINGFDPSGIEEFVEIVQSIRFSNPAHGDLLLFYDDIENSSDLSLTLYDVMGREVRTYDLSALPSRVSIADHPPGFYFFKINDRKKQIYKLIIQ